MKARVRFQERQQTLGQNKGKRRQEEICQKYGMFLLFLKGKLSCVRLQ